MKSLLTLVAVLFTASVGFGAERVTFVETTRTQCTTDVFGRQTCVPVTTMEAVVVNENVGVRDSEGCPCGCTLAGCNCGQSAKVRYENPGALEYLTQSAPVVLSQPVVFQTGLFPGVRSVFAGIRANRQARVSARRAALFGGHSFGGFGLMSLACATCK